MFNKFIAALSALVSLSAFADPKVGDTASYVGTKNGAPMSMTTTITSFDASTSTFLVNTEVTVSGESQTQTEKIPAKNILSDEMLSAILLNCSMYGGALERVTVIAGTFETCNIRGANVGVVLFGVVKVTGMRSDTGLMNFELSSFSRGL